MGDEELERFERKLEGLFTSYGALMETQTRHDERIDNAGRDRAAIREEMRGELAEVHADIKELRLELLAAIGRSEQRTRELITGVKASCDKGWADMAKWVEKEERRKEQDRKDEAGRAERSLMSRRQVTIGVIALVLTALGMIMTLLIVLLGGAG